MYGVYKHAVKLYWPEEFLTVEEAGYTIAHEWGHFALGLYDEYADDVAAGVECAPATRDSNGNYQDAPTLDFCLMDDYQRRGGKATGAGFTLNEFCTSANHDPDGDTAQQKKHGKSCWETIATHPRRKATPPSGAPQSSPPTVAPVNFQVVSSGAMRIALVLDRSRRMQGGRLDLAKEIASQLVQHDMVQPEPIQLGVSSFDCTAQTHAGLQDLDANRVTLNTAVSTISATNEDVEFGPPLGEGLLHGLSVVQSQTGASCHSVVIVLASGHDHCCEANPGCNDVDDAITAFRNTGVAAWVVGIGKLDAVRTTRLQKLAKKTGGQFANVKTQSEVFDSVLNMLNPTVGRDSGESLYAPIGPSATTTEAAFVEPGVESVSFVLETDPQDDVEMSLLTPSGVTLTPLDAATDPDLVYEEDGNGHAYFTVLMPETGTWEVDLYGTTIVDGNARLAPVFAHPGVSLTGVVLDDEIEWPDSAIVQAVLQYDGRPVAGALVAGEVHRPDGSIIAIDLYDDGQNEDGVANDGLYSATFNHYGHSGVYRFTLRAEALPGAVLTSGEPLLGPPPPPVAVPAGLVRETLTTVVLSGVPQYEIDCGDGRDEDADGDADCRDADCWLLPSCDEDCDDGIDNNSTGKIDCADPICGLTSPLCGATCPEATMNDVGTVTGDLTGASDDAQSSCAFYVGGADRTVEFTAPRDGAYVFDLVGTPTNAMLSVLNTCGGNELACDMGWSYDPSHVLVAMLAGQTATLVIDDHTSTAEGRAFTLNVAELQVTEQDCHDGRDLDFDGDRDCFDSDCAADPACFEYICDDGLDDDLDFRIDCVDKDCKGEPECIEHCGDAIDNDADGSIDCYDDDCFSEPTCVENCSNGVDDNLDGRIDCHDPSCLGIGTCDLYDFEVDELGTAVVDATLATLGDDWSCSCASGQGKDAAIAFVSPITGTLVFDLVEFPQPFRRPALCTFDELGGTELQCDLHGNNGAQLTRSVTAGELVTLVVDASRVPQDEGPFQLNIALLEAAESDCGDFRDLDDDGQVDCLDTDCDLADECLETGAECINGWSDDSDGYVDCDDSDCYLEAENCINCPCEYCEDGIDNDNDGSVDCDDPACGPLGRFGRNVCFEYSCTGGQDEDGDGDIDCDDSDCVGSWFCP
ncbi:MAG: VWA domain-containing protein [Myxococcota bacterium]